MTPARDRLPGSGLSYGLQSSKAGSVTEDPSAARAPDVTAESRLLPGRLQSGRISDLFHQVSNQVTSPFPPTASSIEANIDPSIKGLATNVQASKASSFSSPALNQNRMNPAYLHEYQQLGPPSSSAYQSQSRSSSSSGRDVGQVEPFRASLAPSDRSNPSPSQAGKYGTQGESMPLPDARARKGQIREDEASMRGSMTVMGGGMSSDAGGGGGGATEGEIGSGQTMRGSQADSNIRRTFPAIRNADQIRAPVGYGSAGSNELTASGYTVPAVMGPYASGESSQGQVRIATQPLGQQPSSKQGNIFHSSHFSPFQSNAYPHSTTHSAWASSLQAPDPMSRDSSTSSMDGKAQNTSLSHSTQLPSGSSKFGMAPRPPGYSVAPQISSYTSRPGQEQSSLRTASTSAVPSRDRDAEGGFPFPTGARSEGRFTNEDAAMAIAKLEDSSPEPTKAEKEAVGGEKIDHRKRKRNRTIQSCLPCHQNKRKCDRKRPCSRCTALSLTGSCVYEVDVARDPNDPEQADNDHLRGRIAELEQVVRELRAKATRATASNTIKQDEAPATKRRKVDEPLAMVSNGLQAQLTSPQTLGHRSTRSRSSAEGPPALPGQAPYAARYIAVPAEEMVGDVHGRKAYVGEPGGRDLLKKLAALGGGPGSVPEDAAFKGVFPDTRSSFPFTTIWSHEHFSTEIIGLLPTMTQSEVLWTAFEEEIAMFFSAWHLPSLRTEFQSFFRLPDEAKMNTPLGSLSTYLMICALGILVRASEQEIVGEKPGGIDEMEDVTTSRLQSELYLSGAYHALRLCSFFSSPTIATIQTQIMISILLLNSERASDVWPVLGSLIRQAQAIGLNIDPVRHDPQMSLKEAEIRRRIWWTIAGLDSLVCLSLGRPHAITYWSTQLPQDRPDDALIDGQGTASDMFPPSNVLTNEATSASYHTAYFALTIPSIEILERIFQRERRFCRSGTRGWFQAPLAELTENEALGLGMSTYQDAVDLDADIADWYRTIPRGIFFDVKDDTAEGYLATRSRSRINQTLALNVKTNMIRMILHRPYLRADPAAYPRSSAICLEAAHTMLAAYKMMHATGSSIAWSWWTMSLRAFHSAAVLAFIAARQPGLAIAGQCLSDIRGALNIFQGRVSSWPKAHPVQGHLIHGLLALETLASNAIEQFHSRQQSQHQQSAASSSSVGSRSLQQYQSPDGSFRDFSVIPAFPPTPNTAKFLAGDLDSNEALVGGFPGNGDSHHGPHAYSSYPTPPAGSGKPLSRGMPPSSDNMLGVSSDTQDGSTADKSAQGTPMTMPQALAPDLWAMGLGGAPDTLALPQFWAEVFNIPMTANVPTSNHFWTSMPPPEQTHANTDA